MGGQFCVCTAVEGIYNLLSGSGWGTWRNSQSLLFKPVAKNALGLHPCFLGPLGDISSD